MNQDLGELLIIRHFKLYKKIASVSRMTNRIKEVRIHYIELTITLDELFSSGYYSAQKDQLYMYQLASELNKKILLKLESLRK